MQYKVIHDKMGYNWVVGGGGVVEAFGGQKSFPTAEEAAEAFQCIARDLHNGIVIPYTLRSTLGLWIVDTPKESTIRFARMYIDKVAANIQTQSTIDFIEECRDV